MSLQELNALDKTQLKELLTTCCGSSQWVEKMSALFPFANEELLFKKATGTWYACSEDDWLEAFTHHPKIGDIASLKQKFSATADWEADEQAAVKQTSNEILEALSEANRLYQEKFGFIFIVCATGKSAEQMLELLIVRLDNKPEDEIKIAMEEQNKITAIRLEKLLRS
jgi:2-oxo-4-hydroxy-4-carboxy-5-ureidoimidazoline decarboxylase